MRIPLLALLALGAASPAHLGAQEITPEQARNLLEARAPDRPLFAPGEILVRMRDDTPMTRPQLASAGLDTIFERRSGGEYIYRMPAATMGPLTTEQARDSTLAVARRLRQRSDVLYAQPNWILRILDRTPDDPRFPEQWHYFNNGSGTGESPGAIGLPRAWEESTGSADVVVSILDTGILPEHADISGSGNLIDGFDMIGDPTRASDGDGRDGDPTDPGDAVSAGECFPGSPALPDSWHGTHVAGTVGVGGTDNGVGVAGVNWSVSVQAVRVLGKCGGTTADINDAIRWAAGLAVPGVPDNPRPARVINMSLGAGPGLSCSTSPATQAAINDAVAAGAAVAVAAGNSAADAADFLPASCDNVITVAASDYRGRLVTRYSNFGTTVELMAPGGDLNRDDDGDGNPDGVLSMVRGGYAYFNGTSMATPHVAGVAALWLASDPALTPAQLLTELQAAALPRNSTQCPEPCGAGLLSAIRATTPGPLSLTVVLDPDDELGNGETATVRARATRGGTPQSGLTVTFMSADASVATVAPASAVTGSDGTASSTVTGVSRGETTVIASVDGVSASTPVRVPALSVIATLLLGLLLTVAGILRLRRRAPEPT